MHQFIYKNITKDNRKIIIIKIKKINMRTIMTHWLFHLFPYHLWMSDHLILIHDHEQ